jgi:hypothetical protein
MPLLASLNQILDLYRYYQNSRNDKQRYITAQVIGDELTKALDDSFAKCLKEF